MRWQPLTSLALLFVKASHPVMARPRGGAIGWYMQMTGHWLIALERRITKPIRIG